MKRILLLLITVCSLSSQAQLFNNEWIDYNKTYYKFKVGATGLYHINQPLLATMGLGAVNADHFQIWRNGKQVPIYTSVQNAPLAASGYIEFWGEMNDGTTDAPMFREPEFQISDKWSLQTDTAAFFLTVNPLGGNSRLQTTPNNVVGNTLPAEPYFMHTNGKYYKERIHAGRAEIVGDSYTYSSSYDWAEGYSTFDMGVNGTYSFNSSLLQPYTGAGAPAPEIKINAAGNALNPRYFRVKLNGDSVYATPLDYYDYRKVSFPITVAQIASGTANIDVTNVCTTATIDRMCLAQIELVYARRFEFGGATNFPFELPASAIGNYLEITNFNYSGAVSPPILYDLTNGKRYVADISSPGTVKVVLQPSATARKLVLVSQNTSNFYDVSYMQQRNFVNYGLPANQGDYLIITSAVLTGATAGGDPVEDYRQYRSSAAGGSYNAKVYLIDQLIDQFGYGIKMHPLSIRNFIRWARANYSAPLTNILLIGKGVVYTQYRVYESYPDMAKLCLVPTFGNPASDILLSAVGNSSVPLTPIGRISAINKDEVTVYLTKLKEYEQLEKGVSSPFIDDMAWRKNIVHVTGASDDVTTAILQTANDGFRKIIEDTMYGGRVSSFTKSSSESVQQVSGSQLASLFAEGIGILTYFGHSSASTLEFNLDNPQNYNNPGKYPIMVVMGCNAGNFYNFNVARFSTKETISEKYVLAPQRGSVAFLASTHLGIVHYLDIYNTKNYQAISFRKYGQTVGTIMDDAIKRVFAQQTENDFYARFQCEQFSLHGDPALKYYNYPKPDYAIEDKLVKVSPKFISVAEPRFYVNAGFMNLGRSPADSIVIEMRRTFPDNTYEIRRDTIRGIQYMDSIIYPIEIKGLRDKGLNKLIFTIDPDNVVDEIYETNNSITKDIYIYEDEVRPAYPYNYSIVNEQSPTMVASTANAFAEMRSYIMQIDTTELFNSPYKITKMVNAAGGIIEINSGATFTDSTVYYWRIAPAVATGDTIWNVASFIYINGTDKGYAQAHLYQHFKSTRANLRLDSTTRRWSFLDKNNFVFVRNGVYPSTSPDGAFYTGTINDEQGYIAPGCSYNELMINIIDPVTINPWKNQVTVSPHGGLYGSRAPNCQPGRDYNFQFLLGDTSWRHAAKDFLDNVVPDGHYVIIRSNSHPSDAGNTFSSVWKTDESYWGVGNSLYHTMLNQGFTGIDSFRIARSFIFIYRKNRQSEFAPRWSVSEGIYDGITGSADIPAPDSLGFITSPLFGPAKAWHQLKWRGSSLDANPAIDQPSIDVVGVDNGGAETLLYEKLTIAQQDFDLSGVDVSQYPYLKLKMRNMDSLYHTAYQLKYWMLTYDPVPEGAIAPNIYFTTKDTVEVGEPFNFAMAFKNISKVKFDSVKVKLTVTDQSNYERTLFSGKLKDLNPADTTALNVRIPTDELSGHNTLFVNFNPDFDQPEQYLTNNFAFRSLYVRPDSLNPLLDVTFDGTHILNRDIVSSKPEIVIKLKDEAKWMILNDTSAITLKVRYPDQTIRRVYFNNNSDTVQFIRTILQPSNNNEFTINFKPYFPQDGEYELIVGGQDRSGNNAGAVEYRVAFQVINKPMISNMLNYPNPFTTSTAFVFTITGSQVPQNIRIQILTITGKVVREITKDELGPLHVGRNITEFKWDGTDMYGSKLANGIYLYRVITNLNGKSLDKYKADGDNTDKFFNNGYGKMYLMR
jgi:hypothetical protein